MWPSTPSTSVSATPSGSIVIGGNGFDSTRCSCQPVVRHPAQRILVGVVGLDDDADTVRPHDFAIATPGVVATLVRPAGSSDRCRVANLEESFPLAELR
jgi:hypothetical protein